MIPRKLTHFLKLYLVRPQLKYFVLKISRVRLVTYLNCDKFLILRGRI